MARDQSLLAAMNGEGKLKRPPHFVLVPLLAQGHMIPMVDMAFLLAERGAVVSLITTPVNAARIEAIVARAKRAALPLEFVELPFPCADAGLPEGCENVDLLPSEDLLKPFFDATALLHLPLARYLRAQPRPSPVCMISDACNPWTRAVAEELRMPWLVFHGPSCIYLLCSIMIKQQRIYERVAGPLEPFDVPGLPHRLEISMARMPWFFTDPDWEKFRDEVLEAETAADGVVINSFEDLELAYVECYRRELKGKRVWTIGPLSLSHKDAEDKAARGNKASVDKHRVLSWLDGKEPRSVVYVSFGSLSENSASQLEEMGFGLEASGRPFVWVIKEADASSPEVERWLSQPEGGFEERTGDRGLVIRGWAPQAAILAHPAVGGFVTHCGWNSLTEAVSEGLPVATWPRFGDQFINEKLVVDVLRVGVAVGAAAKPGADVVKREEVERAVRRLMDGGEEGEGRRERARELGRKAREAVDLGGSSYANVTELVNYVLHHDQLQG